MDTKHVTDMIEKAAKTERSEDAMRFSQAALNATNALLGLAGIKKSDAA